MATSTIDTASWLPQTFGSRRAQEIPDPLIEPLWDGDRVLVHLDAANVRIADDHGVTIEVLPEIEEAVARLARAERLVLDGYLTPQAARTGEGMILGEVEIPTSRQMTSQLFLGRGRERRRDLADQPPPPVKPGDELVLVCVDLLAIDGEPVLEVPLLERRRLLESAIDEDQLVRIGPSIRPPVDPWMGSWRSQGFRAVAFKAANSRYRPGSVNDDWAMAQIPKR
jgi:ATP-dependent DNA ligase